MPKKQPGLILDITETTSGEFYALQGRGREDFMNIVFGLHTGGTWKLQIQTEDGEWVDTGDTFKAVEAQSINTRHRRPYRLTGGNVGAKADRY